MPERSPELSAGRRPLRLYPPPTRDVGEAGIYGDLELSPPGSRYRPYVLMNMVASVDGRTTISGKASGIGGEADRRAMRALRSGVDAVMVGAGTLRAERLNLGLDDLEAPQPLAVILCGSGPLPLTERLVANSQDILLVIPEDAPDPSTWASSNEPSARAKILSAQTSVPGLVDLRTLLGVLMSEHGVGRLLVEGGPALNHALIEEDLVDEIFLTVAPKIIAGKESTILQGGEAHRTQDLTLLSVHSSGSSGEIFLRYRLRNRS